MTLWTYTTLTDSAPTLTNVETGESIMHASRYQSLETYDATANEVDIVTQGTIFTQFFPSDEGPYGIVDEPGALLSLTGHMELTLDPDTFLFTAFELDGMVNADICELLSS